MPDTSTQNNASNIRYYFVDEGGDSTIFSSNGKVIIETPGCSRFFILGLLDVVDPMYLEINFSELRNKLISDPYFQNVPSMGIQSHKTATIFHAKDDLPEIRKEVFYILRNTIGLRYYAVVTDKFQVLNYVRQRNGTNLDYKYQPNELYDYLVRRLFKNLLHKDSGYDIVFAKRGASNRTEALKKAIEDARIRFAEQWGKTSKALVAVKALSPIGIAGLQAVDYFTWALQRVYEKGEDRYIAYLSSKIKLVQDIHDNRKNNYGTYYSKKNPLTKDSLEWRNQIKKTRDIGLKDNVF